jgi:electron transport complex protein RnfD
MLFAIVVSKHLYGGLGFNVFNPAMVGYAVLMISFPLQMTLWPDLQTPPMRFIDAVDWQFNHQLLPGNSLDAITSATPLDALRTAIRNIENPINIEHLTVIKQHRWVLAGAWLIGGLWLIKRRIAAWQLPVAFLTSLTMLTSFYWLINPGHYPTPVFHLLHGSVIMAAFFILTDPVTAPSTTKGRIIAGILVAILGFVIRNWGGYPEGVAFAVLLMNLAVPLIDRYI